MLDELLIGGEVQETSKKNVLKAISAQDLLQEVSHHAAVPGLIPKVHIKEKMVKEYIQISNLWFSTN